MTSVYDSERLAAAYAFDRPSVHEQFVQSAGLSQQAGRALDVGCGAGLSTAALVPLARHVVGLEPVPAMLAHRHTVAPRARFVIAEAERLPFADASFDLVAAAGSLNYADLPSAWEPFDVRELPLGSYGRAWCHLGPLSRELALIRKGQLLMC